MRLGREAIQEFKEIYKEEYGEEISDQEALEKATRLLRLFQVVYKPIGREIKDKL